MIRDIFGDNAVGTDGGVIADGDFAKDFCTGTDVDVITDDRHPRTFSPTADTDGDIVGEVAIFSDLHIFIGHNATVMTKVKARSDFGFVGNCNSKLDLEMVIHQPGKGEKYAPE